MKYLDKTFLDLKSKQKKWRMNLLLLNLQKYMFKIVYCGLYKIYKLQYTIFIVEGQ